ncbi:hypothetical protein RN2511_049740 [Rhodococcus sp. NKCM2511]|nr:hypothetical protein RN2511_049740 [Rhodococcus sp. NKCM2511]
MSNKLGDNQASSRGAKAPTRTATATTIGRIAPVHRELRQRGIVDFEGREKFAFEPGVSVFELINKKIKQ